MKKKGIVALLFSMVMVFSLCACGGGDGKVSTDSLAYGDEIEFGSYEQNNNTEDGSEPIKWVVTDFLGEDYVILTSVYGLDVQPYNTENKAVTWETCSLRKWLNEDFYNSAFNEEEQAAMSKVNLENPDNSYDGSKGGADTLDLVWIYNEYDARNYIEITEINEGQVATTEYVQAMGIEDVSSYWLRSPNAGSSAMKDVYTASVAWDDSNFGEIYGKVTDENVVRPVIVLKISKDIKVTSCGYSFFEDDGAEIVDAIEVLDPEIGMTKNEVLESTWGEPDDVNVDEYEWGTEEQWVYDAKGYIYFENGIVNAIQHR